MSFVDGDRATAAQAITFEMDITKSATPAYETFCVNSLGEDFGIKTESWSDFCSNGFTSTQAVGYDMSWSGECVVTKGSAAHDFIKHSNTLTLSNLNNIPVRITNALDAEVVSTLITITSLSLTYNSDEMIKFSFEFKPSGGTPTVTPVV